MFDNVREEITAYFRVQGHSRVPEDYANQWLKEHIPGRERDDFLIRTGLRKSLTVIAYEVMNRGEVSKELVDRLHRYKDG